MLPKIKTILYATGLGPAAPYVFRYALSLARQHEARIIAVHGMEPLSTFGQSLVEQYISHEQSEEMHQQARVIGQGTAAGAYRAPLRHGMRRPVRLQEPGRATSALSKASRPR